MSADHALPSFDRATQTESRLRSQPCAVTDVAEHDLTAEIARLRVELEAWKTRAAAAEAAADHDVLTPALNRRGFITAMQRTMAYCQRHGVPAVLLYLDMDGFKSVNDRLGHAAGDAALVAVAELFLANLRESDAVGRLGGDEFALLMLHAGYEEGRAKARQLAEADAAMWVRKKGR